MPGSTLQEARGGFGHALSECVKVTVSQPSIVINLNGNAGLLDKLGGDHPCRPLNAKPARVLKEREKQEWEAQHSALLTEHAGVIEQMKTSCICGTSCFTLARPVYWHCNRQQPVQASKRDHVFAMCERKHLLEGRLVSGSKMPRRSRG